MTPKRTTWLFLKEFEDSTHTDTSIVNQSYGGDDHNEEDEDV